MDCHEFESQVQDRMDQRQDPRSPALEAHAATCESCHDSLANALILLRGVAAWHGSMPSVDFVDRLALAGLVVNDPKTGPDRPDVVEVQKGTNPVTAGKLSGALSWGMVATSAAALCFMFWPASNPQDPRAIQRSIASQRSSNEMRARPTPTEPDLETVLASAGQAYSHLARQTATAAAQDFALLMPSQGFFRSTKSSQTDVDPVPAKPSGLIPENVYPVGDSVENALHYLWRVMPGVEKSAS